MKLLVAAFATWISFALSTSCQLILLPGESFTFEFRDFSFEGSSELGVPGTTRIHFTLPPGLPPPSAWRVDVFENRVSDLPLLSSISPSSPILLGPAWQADRQGVVRFTALVRPLRLDLLSASILLPDRRLFEQSALLQPLLGIQPLGQGRVQLTWSTNFIGLTLEQTGRLPAVRWNPVGNPVTVVQERFSVTVDVGEAQRFFRLRML